MFPKFSTTTGNTFWQFSGIFLENDCRYWFLPVPRPDASAPVAVENQSPIDQRRRNDNINKICVLEGVGEGKIYGKLSKNAVFFFPGKFHDNKIWNFCEFYCQKFLGPAFGRTDFSRIFIFEPPDFFADFLAGFFLLIFVGKSAQKNPPGKSLAKSSKTYTTKILQHISADCPGQKFCCHLGGS